MRRKTIAVRDLLAWCRKVAGNALDGVTISGGEPFEQPAGLRALLAGLLAWRRAADLDFDILCYSGYPLRTLERKHAKLLALLDAVIPEPYVDDLPQGNVWRGSRNQPLVPLSERGRARYAALRRCGGRRGRQAHAGGGRGRPRLDDRHSRHAATWRRVEALCASRGLALTKVSWRR